MVITEQEFLEAVEAMRPDLIEAARVHSYHAPDDAEDAVQEGIMYCLNRINKFNPELASLKTWVITAIKSRALNQSRQRDRKYGIAVENQECSHFDEFTDREMEKIENDDGVLDWPTRAQRKAALCAEEEGGYDPQTELIVSVRQAINKLEPGERDVAIAVLMEGYTVVEYSEKANVHRHTVARRLEKARQKLAELLADFDT